MQGGLLGNVPDEIHSTDSAITVPNGAIHQPVQPTALLASVGTASASATKTQKTTSYTKIAKRYAWRVTATWIWVHIFAATFGGNRSVDSFEEFAIRSLMSLLSRLRFTPANPTYLPTVLKWTWLLLINGFSLLKLFGFGFYVLGFPALALWLIAFRDVHRAATAVPAVPVPESRPGLHISNSEMPVRKIVIISLCGWGLLYGGSGTRRPDVARCRSGRDLAVAGQIVYSFRQARPAEDEEFLAAQSIGNWGITYANRALQQIETHPPMTAAVTLTSQKLAKPILRFYRFLSLFFRGGRGRERAAMLILLDYLSTVTMLAASAIVFWSLTFRMVTPTLRFSEALWISAQHALPGLPSTADIGLPWWCHLGAGITSLLLFVVYVGIAASLLPSRQKRMISVSTTSYRLFRRAFLLVSKYVKRLASVDVAIRTKQ